MNAILSSSLVSETSFFFFFGHLSEAHPDMIQGEGGVSLEGYQSDLAYLKRKVCPECLSNLLVRLSGIYRRFEFSS